MPPKKSATPQPSALFGKGNNQKPLICYVNLGKPIHHNESSLYGNSPASVPFKKEVQAKPKMNLFGIQLKSTVAKIGQNDDNFPAPPPPIGEADEGFYGNQHQPVLPTSNLYENKTVPALPINFLPTKKAGPITYDIPLPPPPVADDLTYGNAMPPPHSQAQSSRNLPPLPTARPPPKVIGMPMPATYDVPRQTVEEENIYEGINQSLPQVPLKHCGTLMKKSLPAIPVEMPEKTVTLEKPEKKVKSVKTQKKFKVDLPKPFQLSGPLIVIQATFSILYTFYYAYISLLFFEVIE